MAASAQWEFCEAHWRHRNGAAWRAIPAGLGPWWHTAQIFIRWTRAGVWEHLLDLAQACGVALGMVFLDGTNIRAHQKAAGRDQKRGGAERDDREAPGRSRGGSGTKACVIADGRGRPVGFRLAPGQAHALPLLDHRPGTPERVVADRGCSSHGFREAIWTAGARPAIPTKSNAAPVACPAWIDDKCNIVERLWARLKERRAVATCYQKTAVSFMGVLCLASTLLWIN